MARRKKILFDVTITGVADKGKAVGRNKEGQVVFVDKAVPGDVVDVLVLRKKKGLPFGIVKDFKKMSDDRIPAKCQHFGICGGCKWQNLSYETQLKHKTQTVVDAMQRIAKIDTSIIKKILPSPRIFQYRNKLEYSFSTKRWLTKEEINNPNITERGSALGFHPPGSYDKIVPISECLLQDNYGNEIRNHIAQFCKKNSYSFYDYNKNEGLMRNLVLRNNANGQWMVTLVFGEKNDKKINTILEDLQSQFSNISSLFYVINLKKNDSLFDQEFLLYYGKPVLSQKLNDIRYEIGPKSFFQTNTFQTETMYSKVKELSDLTGEETVYDLYTGLGSIALFVADQAKKVIGIEEVEAAILDANRNAQINNIDNCLFYAGDVKDILNDRFIEKHGKPDILITDPPRAGMHKDVVQTILNASPKKIIYVSCNPSTQARDLALMKDKYTIQKMQPLDMFPHTHHIENIAVLVRK